MPEEQKEVRTPMNIIFEKQPDNHERGVRYVWKNSSVPNEQKEVGTPMEVIVERHPEIHGRTVRFLKDDPSLSELKALTAELKALLPEEKTPHESTVRKRRLRERRQHAGMKAYEVWFDQDGQVLIEKLRRPNETVNAFFTRALIALKDGGHIETSHVSSHETSHETSPDDMSPLQRKALLVARLQRMKAQGLSLQTIANQLNQAGVPTSSGRGAWKKGTIGKLLSEVS